MKSKYIQPFVIAIGCYMCLKATQESTSLEALFYVMVYWCIKIEQCLQSDPDFCPTLKEKNVYEGGQFRILWFYDVVTDNYVVKDVQYYSTCSSRIGR